MLDKDSNTRSKAKDLFSDAPKTSLRNPSKMVETEEERAKRICLRISQLLVFEGFSLCQSFKRVDLEVVGFLDIEDEDAENG
ncbi:hypothetical protein BGX29_009143 [Mortierella sp. GBA35]|nr:hypothetical protein BGX29_009143 [Mortierella sp. GBA35]